ncbi:MAG: hypothetical protein HXX18_13970 [Bacteroidetes bacterium]|nr:hypothetical protein [Bacteroidota bacterium]
METDFKTFANKVINTDGLPSKKKILMFSFCLFISLFFWMLIKFSKEFQLTVVCPVSFVNLPNDKVLMNNSDTAFLITIRTKGFNLLYYQLFKKKFMIKVDASLLKYAQGSNDTISYLGASELSKLVNKQFDFDYETVNIVPDTYTLLWEKAYLKKIAVKSNLTLNFKEQFQLYDTIKMAPDSILVSGTKSDLEQIKFFTTQRITLKNVCRSEDVFADILKPSVPEKVKIFTQKVKLSIAVERFTESEIEIPITPSVNGSNIKLFPERVKITYQVALKDFKKVNREMFVVYADINRSIVSDGIHAKVDLIKAPDLVKITKVYPEKIEYIIFK